MTRELILLISLVLSLPAFGQRYEPLKSSGEIPNDFLLLSSEKVKDETAFLDSVKNRSVRKAKSEFYLESNYIIDGLLRSGQVTFNDPVSRYVNKVADEILKDDPELRKELRFYAVKSPYVNAFTTNSGIIFVNVGLLGQLENEAQLAYILCHEIIHYKEKHAINSYIESVELTKAARRFQISFNDALLARSNYSQDLEMESDKEGLELYSTTNYDPRTVEDVFFVLEFSHLPFDEVVYKKEFLETEHMRLPDEYYLEEVSEIESGDEENDEYSTHPNCEERRSQLRPTLANMSSEGKSLYLVGEDEFKEIQKLARYEMTRYYINERQYGAALYNAYLLLENDSADAMAIESYLKALNYLVKYKNREYTYGVLRSHYYIQGESQQLNYLLGKIDAEELNTLSLAKAWQLKSRFPENQKIRRLANSLMYELATHHNDDVSRYRQVPEAQDSTVDEPVEDKKLSKYDKIRKKISRDDYENDSTNVLYAFHDFLGDTMFLNDFEKNAKRAQSAKDEEEKFDASSLKKKREKERQVRDFGVSLGIDKVLLLDPRYYKIKESRTRSLSYEKSEEAQLRLVDNIRSTASLCNLDVQLLSPLEFNSAETEKFNDYAQLAEWARERYEHSENIEETVKPSSTEYLDPVIDKYGTRYLAVTRVFNMKKSDPNRYLYACLCCAGVYTAPLGIYYLLKTDQTTDISFVLLDMKTGEFVFEDNTIVNGRDRDSVVKSRFYHIFNQIKRSK